MLSTNTYTEQTIPYFYIIRHIESGKMYAGSKWTKNCHPNSFMKSDGYTTSSPTINSIIEYEGLTSFEILRIDTNLDGVSAYDYETIFLKTNNCAKSLNWFNKHNNNGKCNRKGSKNSDFQKLTASKTHKNKIVSEETKKKQSESHKKPRPYRVGIPRSIETKNKISESVKRINYGVKTCPICGFVGKVPSVYNHIKKCNPISISAQVKL